MIQLVLHDVSGSDLMIGGEQLAEPAAILVSSNGLGGRSKGQRDPLITLR